MVANWQFSYNGLTFGDGTDYELMRLEGLNPPDSRIDSVNRMEDHGAFVFAEFKDLRTLTFDGEVVGTTGADFEGKINDLREAFAPQADPLPLIFLLPGDVQKRILCVPTRTFFEIDPHYSIGYAPWTVQLLAEDPRIYSDTEETLSLTPGTSAGITFSVQFSMDFGGGYTGAGFAVNDGVFPTNPVVTITGSVTNPRIIHTGPEGTHFIQVDIMLAGSDSLVIDFNEKTIELNGVSRYGNLNPESEWWHLDPGSNEITFIGDGGTALVKWRDAWI